MKRYKLLIIPLVLLLAASLALSAGIATKKTKVEPAPVKLPTSTTATQATSGTSAATHPLTGEQISWQVLSSGGTVAASTNYSMQGTLAQTAVGSGSSVNYQLAHGFWQSTSGSSAHCCQIVGDVNHDGAGPDIADLVYLVNYMFNGGPPPPCDDGGLFVEADVNGDGAGPDIADLVYLVNYMFNGGPPPADCP